MIPTRQEALAADPGIELDTWVFTHVIGRCATCGWPLSKDHTGCTLDHCSWVGEPNTSPLPLYSVSAEHAARVLERMLHLEWGYTMGFTPGKAAHCSFIRGDETYVATGKQVPEAIAKAALLACLGLKEIA